MIKSHLPIRGWRVTTTRPSADRIRGCRRAGVRLIGLHQSIRPRPADDRRRPYRGRKRGCNRGRRSRWARCGAWCRGRRSGGCGRRPYHYATTATVPVISSRTLPVACTAYGHNRLAVSVRFDRGRDWCRIFFCESVPMRDCGLRPGTLRENGPRGSDGGRPGEIAPSVFLPVKFAPRLGLNSIANGRRVGVWVRGADADREEKIGWPFSTIFSVAVIC